MKRIISVLIENAPGALSRVVGLFSQRGYNIETLTVAPTEDETLSRITLTTIGDDHKIEQITKHLNKLIDVVKLVDLTEGAHIEPDADQGQSFWRPAGRSEALCGYLPRPDCGCDRFAVRDPDHRDQRQAGCLSPGGG